MGNLLITPEDDIQLISIVIPSINGDYAKLLFLTGNEYAKLKETAQSNRGKRIKIFALYFESNVYHDLLDSAETGCITREQFDGLLKENYNSKMQQGRGGKYLKPVI